MNIRRPLLLLGLALVVAFAPSAAIAAPPSNDHGVARLVSGLEGGSGSTVGPGGALYVTEPIAGRVSKVDRKTGHVSTFATGLPKQVPGVGLGGAMDVAFLHGKAYVLVTLVGPDVGGSDIVGIYRMDSPHKFTAVADVGAFAIANPPEPEFFVPSGVQYAMQAYRGGFLVTDGHHNRVYKVTRDGKVSELIAFGNIVPTGLDVKHGRIFMAEAGPTPHLPEVGKIVSFGFRSPVAHEVAVGGRLLVDVEFGRRGLYALAQGVWPVGSPEGSPALPNTGKLLRVNRHGGFTTVARGLNQPTSLEIVGKTAYVVTLTGEIWTVKHLSGHHGSK